MFTHPLLMLALLTSTVARATPPAPPLVNWTAARAGLKAVAPFAAGALVGAALVAKVVAEDAAAAPERGASLAAPPTAPPTPVVLP